MILPSRPIRSDQPSRFTRKRTAVKGEDAAGPMLDSGET